MSEKKKFKNKDSKKELQTSNHSKDKKSEKKGKQLTFDLPSEKMVHQILPFVFIVFAILFEVCFVLASLTGEQYVGVAGVFLKNTFLGLLGACAFLIPVALLNFAANWRKFVDSNVVLPKVIFSFLFLVSFSGLIHIFIRSNIDPNKEAFILPRTLFEYSCSNLMSSGIIGGFVCECIYSILK